MRKLITVNLISGFVLSIANSYFLYIDIVLFSCLTYFLLLILIFVNLISIFTMWHDYKYFSFIPFAVSLLFLSLAVIADYIDIKVGMYNSPGYPDKYFNEERKNELTAIAEGLLGSKDEKDRQVIEKRLRNHRLVIGNINFSSNVVEFDCYGHHMAFAYIFAKDGLPENYSIAPVITEEDIGSWVELVNIFNPKNSPLNYGRGEVAFVPEIAYPYLTKSLDKSFIDKVAAMESYDDYMARNKIDPYLVPNDERYKEWRELIEKKYKEYHELIESSFSKEEKLKVIEVLNRQCRISSGLVEDSNISGTPKWKFLHIPGTGGFDTRSQVGKHFKQLISDGVISYKDNEGHLQLKSNLNDQEIREIEWFQVEMMDRIYGNLIRKEEYWANGKTKLADNWYFCGAPR